MTETDATDRPGQEKSEIIKKTCFRGNRSNWQLQRHLPRKEFPRSRVLKKKVARLAK